MNMIRGYFPNSICGAYTPTNMAFATRRMHCDHCEFPIRTHIESSWHHIGNIQHDTCNQRIWMGLFVI